MHKGIHLNQNFLILNLKMLRETSAKRRQDMDITIYNWRVLKAIEIQSNVNLAPISTCLLERQSI